jgi:two-component system, OmpR family, sensor kinase
VLRDDHQLVGSGTSNLLDLVDNFSKEKTAAFLAAVTHDGAAFDWELNLVTGHRVTTFEFAGAADGDGFFIVAANASEEVERLLDELTAVNNEQANALRSALRERQEVLNQKSHREHVYNELSKLNNELSNAHRELARREAELTRLNEEKNRFLGMAAHDLRSPLSVIYTYSGLLLSDTNERLTESEREAMAEIRFAAEHMLRLINDLLDVAKIESGRAELDLEELDPSLLIRRALRHCKAGAEQKNISLVHEADPGSRTIRADAMKLHQVVVNLVNNAIRYSPEGSRVRVDVSFQPGTCTISVHDEGYGIPSDALDRIFNPFERLERSGGHGAGLGLLIVKRLVDLLGGRVHVESEIGRGSSFFVQLPAEDVRPSD